MRQFSSGSAILAAPDGDFDLSAGNHDSAFADGSSALPMAAVNFDLVAGIAQKDPAGEVSRKGTRAGDPALARGGLASEGRFGIGRKRLVV